MPNLFDRTGVLKTLPKFKMILNPQSYRMAHPVYKLQDIESIKHYHHEPENFKDKLAMTAVKIARTSVDLMTRYNPEKMNERQWLNRIIFLETVAGVPGMVGGMMRHIKSLRTLERDHGWIHHLLQEAENERMHLFIFLNMRSPGVFFRAAIGIAQFVFINFFSLTYLISPRFAHRFVGYLEEEAVHTYTLCLEQIDKGQLPLWQVLRAPTEAIEYYGLDPETSTMRDVVLSVRADEAVHRSVNHHFSDIPDYYDVEQQQLIIGKDGFRDVTDEKLKLLEEHGNISVDQKAKLIASEMFAKFTNEGHPKITRSDAPALFEAVLKQIGFNQIKVDDALVDRWFKAADKDETKQLSQEEVESFVRDNLMKILM